MTVPHTDHPASEIAPPRPVMRTPLYDGPRWSADSQFATMQRAYASHGAMSTGDELLMRARLSSRLPISSLARPIAMRELVSLQHKGQLLLPNFQFRPGTLELLPLVAQAVRMLRDVLDDWELALWFATPNPCLQDETPVAAVAWRADDVLRAARERRDLLLGGHRDHARACR